MAASDAFYNEIKVEVDELLAELGTTYNVRSEGAYDTDLLTTSPGATRTVTGIVANQQFVNSVSAILFPVGEASATWIAKKTLILTAESSPLPGEDVQVDGDWFPLAKSVPIKPADVVVVFMLDVTR